MTGLTYARMEIQGLMGLMRFKKLTDLEVMADSLEKRNGRQR